MGASGNIELVFPSTYEEFKYACFPHLRTFLFAGKPPTYLTKVVRMPNVPEIDKRGTLTFASTQSGTTNGSSVLAAEAAE